MAFNLPQFLRRAPRPSLSEYFRFRSVALAAEFDWSAAPRAYLERLRAEVENLPDGARERVYQDFEHTALLADEPGQFAVRSVFAERASFLSSIERMDNSEARSLAAMMEDEALFRKALAARLADRLRTGRSWSGFIAKPKSAFGGGKMAEDGLADFEADIRSIFRKLDGSGRKLAIDRFERDNPRTPGKITQYTVFVEGLPQASNEFEGGQLVPRARYPVFEAALCHDAALETVDVVCKGGREIRLEIARAFTRRLLGSENDPEAVRLRRIDLDGLKSRMPFDTDPGDGVRRVSVTLLRLRDADESFGRITLEVGGEGDSQDIWSRSSEWFEDFDPLMLTNWSVTQANLRVEFHAENDGGSEKAVTADLRAPHGTNLKDLPRRYATIVEKNLLRWGLLQNVTS
jgi:hypothetical protein